MANHNRLPLVGVLLAGVALTVGGARWWSERTERQFQAHLSRASVTELQTIAAKRDWDPQVFYWLGVRQQQAGKYSEAVTALARSASLDPTSAPAKNAFHQALEQDQEAQLRKSTLPQLMQAAANNRDNPQVWYWLGSKLTMSGKQKEAVQALSRSVALNPKSASARAALGLALARADRPQEAEAQLKDAITLDPKSEFAHFSLGNLYGKHNRWEQAAQALQIAITLDPDDQEANYLLAVCYGNMYIEDRKQEILERLVSRSPDNPRFLKSLGYVYLYFGKFAQAEATYRHILAVAPGDMEARYLLGRSLAEQANTPEVFATAEKELKDVAAKVPDSPGVHLALGILYFRHNQPAQAVPELEEAVRQNISEHKTLLYLGQAYLRVGRTAEGERTLDRFQRDATATRQISQLENRLMNSPNDKEARLRLARVYMDKNDYRHARSHLTLLFEQDKNNANGLRMWHECQVRDPKGAKTIHSAAPSFEGGTM